MASRLVISLLLVTSAAALVERDLRGAKAAERHGGGRKLHDGGRGRGRGRGRGGRGGERGALSAAPAFDDAQIQYLDGHYASDNTSYENVHWMIFNGVLVFLMQYGFAMLCAGSYLYLKKTPNEYFIRYTSSH